jgi:hypothetical protein
MRIELIVTFLDGDPDIPIVTGPSGGVTWRANDKISRTTFKFVGGSWNPPEATVPPSGGKLLKITGSFAGNGAAVNISLDAPGLFPPKVPSKHTTIAIVGGSISEVGGSTVAPTTTTTCSPSRC